MHTTSYLVLFLYLYLSNAQINNNNNNQLHKSTKTLDLSSIKTKWIHQPIDHFNKIDTRKWQMKYFVNKEKWHKGGPVYIYIGGEQTMNRRYLSNGLIYELAEETNGAMFATEHRYDGKSKPFNKVTRGNIHYLNSEQALADLANLITERIKNKAAFKKSKVVVIGGSYAGNLAAWMRLRYPNLVDAAISSSAPVLAKLEFEEFLETVGNVFRRHAKKNCFHQVMTAFENYKKDLKSEIGIEKLKNEQNICKTSDLTKLENQAEFFDEMIHKLTNIAQNGVSHEFENYCNDPATKFCNKSEGCCNIDFDDLYYVGGSCAPLHEDDFWTYQMCNEFGYFFTAPKKSPLDKITMNIDYSIKICSRLFGEKYTKEYIAQKIKDTNDRYGGLNPKVTNVIFVHGAIDPWKKLGIVKKLSKTAPAIVIPGASHCNDLYSDDARTTTNAVKEKKIIEKEIIKKWIGYNK